MTGRWTARSLAATSLCVTLAAQVAGGAPLLQLEPGVTLLDAAGDGTATARVVVRNLGAQPARARLALADWVLLPDGSRELLPAGSGPATLAGWVRFHPADLALEPGEARTVTIAVAMPEDGPATRLGALIAAPATESGAVPRGPAATLVVSRAAATAVEIAGLGVRPAAAAAFEVALRVWNGGGRAVEAGGEVVIRDAAGEARARGRFARAVVLPHSARTLTWLAPAGLPPGGYDVVATLRAGGTEATTTTGTRLPLGTPEPPRAAPPPRRAPGPR